MFRMLGILVLGMLIVKGMFGIRSYAYDNPDKPLSKYIHNVIDIEYSGKNLIRGVIGALPLCLLTVKACYDVWKYSLNTGNEVIIFFVFGITLITLVFYLVLGNIIISTILFFKDLKRKDKN